MVKVAPDRPLVAVVKGRRAGQRCRSIFSLNLVRCSIWYSVGANSSNSGYFMRALRPAFRGCALAAFCRSPVGVDLFCGRCAVRSGSAPAPPLMVSCTEEIVVCGRCAPRPARGVAPGPHWVSLAPPNPPKVRFPERQGHRAHARTPSRVAFWYAEVCEVAITAQAAFRATNVPPC